MNDGECSSSCGEVKSSLLQSESGDDLQPRNKNDECVGFVLICVAAVRLWPSLVV